MRTSDQQRKLADYFKKNLKKGYTTESLKWALINQGYSRNIVEQSLDIAHQEMALEAPVIREKPVIKYEVYDENDRLVETGKKSFWERFREFLKGK